MSTLPPAAIFRAYDVRGVAGRDLTEEGARLIARAFASETRERGYKRIALARDGRLSSPALHRAAAEGMVEAGVDVLDLGAAPTPLLYFAAARHADGCGLMVTGSHNPPDYNGLKLSLGGAALYGGAVQALRERILRGALASGQGEYGAIAPGTEYLDAVAANVRPVRPLHLVVDGGNGIAGPLAVSLLERLGCRVEPLFCEVDGRFPNHHPDPSRPELLTDLARAVVHFGADLGLALDGDGDRLGVVLPDGEVIWPDRLLALFARAVLAGRPGSEVVFDVKCSGRLRRAVEDAGGRAVMWRAGHSLIRARMRSGEAVLGGELTGHFFFADRWFGFDDALYAAARLVELLAADPRPPVRVLAELPQGETTPELRIPLREGEPAALMERILGAGACLEGSVTTLDGLRADYADGWGLVRASNTEPALVLRFEGDTSKALEAVQGRFRKLLLDLEPSLTLPF